MCLRPQMHVRKASENYMRPTARVLHTLTYALRPQILKAAYSSRPIPEAAYAVQLAKSANARRRFTHTLLILYAYFTHNLRMIYSYVTHYLLIYYRCSRPQHTHTHTHTRTHAHTHTHTHTHTQTTTTTTDYNNNPPTHPPTHTAQRSTPRVSSFTHTVLMLYSHFTTGATALLQLGRR